jgi:mannose-6-phosphate isomerase-like protein (cupin superfamily)
VTAGAGKEVEGEALGIGVCIIVVDAPPGEGPSLHRHPYEEVFVVHSGSGTFTIGEDSLEAGPGDIVVAPPRTPHGFVNSGPEQLRLVAVHHSPKFVTEWLD